jgi:hypothetical protein
MCNFTIFVAVLDELACHTRFELDIVIFFLAAVGTGYRFVALVIRCGTHGEVGVSGQWGKFRGESFPLAKSDWTGK